MRLQKVEKKTANDRARHVASVCGGGAYIVDGRDGFLDQGSSPLGEVAREGLAFEEAFHLAQADGGCRDASHGEANVGEGVA